MGTEMVAFIEYDRTTDWWPRSQWSSEPPPPPFADSSGEAYSVSQNGSIYTGSKDYTLFGAIAGVRNDTDIPPLFPPRGLPPNLSPEVSEYLNSEGEVGEFCTSWLRLSEINAALDHQKVDRELLSFETHTILAIMKSLADRLGDDRVRVVFGFLG